MICLVVAAHPDDEVLGCGATMARHVRSGDEVHVLILAEGASSRSTERGKDVEAAIGALARAAREAGRIIGCASVVVGDLPDNRLDTIARLDIARRIEDAIARVRPHIVYTHHTGDLNGDHAIVADCTQIACRPVGEQTVARILAFETPSSTEWSPQQAFVPNWFVDASETLSVKLEALRAYDAEIRAFPHPRSYAAVEHLARWRGACAGFEAAEAFSLVRSRER